MQCSERGGCRVPLQGKSPLPIMACAPRRPGLTQPRPQHAQRRSLMHQDPSAPQPGPCLNLLISLLQSSNATYLRPQPAQYAAPRRLRPARGPQRPAHLDADGRRRRGWRAALQRARQRRGAGKSLQQRRQQRLAPLGLPAAVEHLRGAPAHPAAAAASAGAGGAGACGCTGKALLPRGLPALCCRCLAAALLLPLLMAAPARKCPAVCSVKQHQQQPVAVAVCLLPTNRTVPCFRPSAPRWLLPRQPSRSA